jgi:hypothetical protein
MANCSASMRVRRITPAGTGADGAPVWLAGPDDGIPPWGGNVADKVKAVPGVGVGGTICGLGAGGSCSFCETAADACACGRNGTSNSVSVSRTNKIAYCLAFIRQAFQILKIEISFALQPAWRDTIRRSVGYWFIGKRRRGTSCQPSVGSAIAMPSLVVIIRVSDHSPGSPGTACAACALGRP